MRASERRTDVVVNIDVDNLERATAFYCSAFRLEVGRRLGSGVVELLGAPVALYLLRKSEGSASSTPTSELRRYARHWTPVHLDFVVSDLDAALDRARDAGATLEDDVRTHAWGRIAVLADPFGHGFCLIEFLGRGYDEVAS